MLLIVQPGAATCRCSAHRLRSWRRLLTASVTIVIRRLGKTEQAATTVFWFAVSSLVPLGLLMLFFARLARCETWAILAGLALAGGIAQLTLTGALRLAPVALVMPMDYTSLLWALLARIVDVRRSADAVDLGRRADHYRQRTGDRLA